MRQWNPIRLKFIKSLKKLRGKLAMPAAAKSASRFEPEARAIAALESSSCLHVTRYQHRLPGDGVAGGETLIARLK
jgi:hypothetical protein